MGKVFEELKKIALEEFGVSIKKVKRKTPLTFELLFGISDDDLINMESQNIVGNFEYQANYCSSNYSFVEDDIQPIFICQDYSKIAA